MGAIIVTTNDPGNREGPDMSPTVITDVTEHERRIGIENGPVVAAGYPRGEYEIEAWQITIRWIGTDAPMLVHVSGPRILKSGALGKWRSVCYNYGRHDRFNPPAPTWLMDLVK
jgi:hypothetical protein